MNDKKIIIGNVKEDFSDTPINIFKKAIELSKQDKFILHTNNPLLVEAIEILCGEENITILLKHKYLHLEELDCIEAYNYLGDVYDILNGMRFLKEIKSDFDDDYELSDEYLEKEIKEYEEKWCKK